jgi:hypothetical protein
MTLYTILLSFKFYKITLATLWSAKNISKRRYIGNGAKKGKKIRRFFEALISGSISYTLEVGWADKIQTMGAFLSLHRIPSIDYEQRKKLLLRVPPKKEDCWHLEKTTIKTKFPHKLRLLQTLRKGEVTNGSFAQGHCLFLPLFVCLISEFFA